MIRPLLSANNIHWRDLFIHIIKRIDKRILFVLIISKDKSKGKYNDKGKGKVKGTVLATTYNDPSELLGNAASLGRYEERVPKVHVPIPTP